MYPLWKYHEINVRKRTVGLHTFQELHVSIYILKSGKSVPLFTCDPVFKYAYTNWEDQTTTFQYFALLTTKRQTTGTFTSFLLPCSCSIRKWKYSDGEKIVFEIRADSDCRPTILKTWRKEISESVWVCVCLSMCRIFFFGER